MKKICEKVSLLGFFAASICLYQALPLSLCPWKCYLSSKYYLNKEFSESKDEDGVPHYYVDADGEDSLGGVFEGLVKKIGRDGDLLYADVKKCWSGDISARYALNMTSGEIFMVSDASPVVMHPPDVFFDENKQDGKWIALYWGLVCCVMLALKFFLKESCETNDLKSAVVKDGIQAE